MEQLYSLIGKLLENNMKKYFEIDTDHPLSWRADGVEKALKQWKGSTLETVTVREVPDHAELLEDAEGLIEFLKDRIEGLHYCENIKDTQAWALKEIAKYESLRK